jgi:hypothetical protein
MKRLLWAILAIGVFLCVPAIADSEACYLDAYGNAVCPDCSPVFVSDDGSSSTQLLYLDFSWVYCTIATYENPCNGHLSYVAVPRYRYCQHEVGACLARDAYPDLPSGP